MNILTRILVRSAPLALLAPLAFGQTAPSQIDDEDVIQLSPFTVDAGEDTGYNATSTLAGTRLRTQLKDLGTSVQVITKDFMNDIGAVDAESLLLFTTNTEVGGINGNYSGEDATSLELNSASSRSNPQGANRVRGLFKADLTRNYFRTIVPFDTYNTSTVSINRGSNSTLFGVGSPAGIIENSTDAPRWKDNGEIKARFDSEGSVRGEINVNKVLIKDQLAIRAAYVRDDRKYYQRNAFQDAKRGYVAANWRITPTTTLRANYEKGSIRANRPDPLSPMEAISPWIASGKPTLNTNLATGLGGYAGKPTGIKVDKDGDGILDDVYPEDINAGNNYSYSQFAGGPFTGAGTFTWNARKNELGATAQPTLPGAQKLQTGGLTGPAIFNQIALPYVSGSSVPAYAGFVAVPPNNFHVPGDALSLQGDGQDPYGNFKGTPNLKDFFNNYLTQGYTTTDGAFNWGRNLIEGGTAGQADDFTALNLTLEQTFLDGDAGIELAYDRQTFDRNSYIPLQFRNNSDLQVDVNEALPDGRLNPNFGRPFALSRGGRSYRENELSTQRATGFIQHDFTRHSDGGWIRHLGRHTLTGLYDRNEQYIKSYGSSMVWGDADVRRVLGTETNATHFNNQVSQLVYLGPSLLGNDVQSLADVVLESPQGLNLWAPNTTVPVTFWDPGINSANGKADTNANRIRANGKMVTKEAEIIEGFGTGATYSQTVTDSVAAVWQSYFLRNHVVGTIGYRKDTVENEVIKGAPRDDAYNTNPFAPYEEWTGLDSATATDSRFSYGAVVHLPQSWTPWRDTQFSLHFAQSSNFTLEPGRVNWNNVPIPDPTGDTREAGFSVSTFEGRFNMKLNWFETSLSGQTGPYGTPQWNLIYQGASNYAKAAHTTSDPLFKAFDLAVAEQLLSFVTPGMQETHNVQAVRNADGELTNVTYSTVKAPRDTQDVTSQGFEVEFTFNPTKNWRMHLNLAQQESIKNNVQPHSSEQLPVLQGQMAQPIPGFEWMTAGQVNRSVRNETNWVIDPATQTYADLNNPGNDYNMQSEFLETKLLTFRTAKGAEGSASPEQREWRANFVTSYAFNEGRLKGLQVGGSYRWQSKLGVGYALITDPDTGFLIGDLANPVYAPAMDSVDLFTSYTLPWFQDYGRWSIRAQVSNVFADPHGVTPVSVQPDGVSWARVRLDPQRLWVLSSTFRW